jgi:hypothetical protein
VKAAPWNGSAAVIVENGTAPASTLLAAGRGVWPSAGRSLQSRLCIWLI